MVTNGSTQLRTLVQRMPKVELHRHLEGSVRLTTLVDVAREHGIEMPEYDPELLRPFVQMMPQEARNPRHFLAKFLTLRQFFRSRSVIERIAREVVEDAAADNVLYLELRFTPPALSNLLECSFDDVTEWVCGAASAAAAAHGLDVRYILSINRHEPVALGQAVLDTALRHRDLGVVALDLAGNEESYPAEPFEGIFQQARAEGLGVTIHAGEWAGPASVMNAVTRLGAQRLGHGVRLAEDRRLTEQLAAAGIVLEVCPTSNVHSGVVADWTVHPLPTLFRDGIATTINTDDPLVSDITLSDEYQRAVQEMGLSLGDLRQHLWTAVEAAFIPSEERRALRRRMDSALEALLPA